jgi:hypothetical protein
MAASRPLTREERSQCRVMASATRAGPQKDQLPEMAATWDRLSRARRCTAAANRGRRGPLSEPAARLTAPRRQDAELRASGAECVEPRKPAHSCRVEKVGSQFLSLRQLWPPKHSPLPCSSAKIARFHRLLRLKLWTASSVPNCFCAPFGLSCSKPLDCADSVRNCKCVTLQELRPRVSLSEL